MNQPKNQIIKELSNGFSLMEVLIFVAILGFVFIAAATVGTVSLRNSQNSEHKILATHYGEELYSWLSSQKDADWLAFVDSSTPSPKTYCFSDEPINLWPSSGKCSFSGWCGKRNKHACNWDKPIIGTIFGREVTLTYDADQRVNVEIHVRWNEGDNSFDVPIKGVFTLFE